MDLEVCRGWGRGCREAVVEVDVGAAAASGQGFSCDLCPLFNACSGCSSLPGGWVCGLVSSHY